MKHKKCKKCNTEKNQSDFGKDSSKKDKLRTLCKMCSRKYDIERSKSPERKSYMAGVKLEYKLSGKAVESARQYRINNPKKSSAHMATTSAIRSGKLVKKPCELCGNEKVYAHHDDYNNHMAVRWLCDVHHREWHKENGEGLNGS